MAYQYQFGKEGAFDESDNIKDRTKGYELLKEDNIKCANCKKKLVEIVKVKENESKVYEIKASCPFCGDSSFIYRISGQIFIQAASGVTIEDMPMEIVNEVMKTDIKVIKNG